MAANNSAGALEQTQLPAARAGGVTIGGELTVNRMGFGAMRITGKGVWGPPADRAECLRVLRRAVELGVDFIDTADSYGPYVSEELIAEALHPYPAGLVIATKSGFERQGPNKWTENGNPKHLRAALEGSLKRLKVERIDLWQLHRIDSKVPADDQFGVLADFVREGKVRHVGLSEVGTAQIAAAARVLPIVSVQNQYNVVDRKWESVVDYCTTHGMAFIPWHPLGAGSLHDQAKKQNADRQITEIATRHGATNMQVALAWLLAHSPTMLVIPGTSSVPHLEENVGAAGVELTPEELKTLSGLVQ